MPLPLSSSATTLLVRKSSYERSGLTRVQIDQALTLTDEEFRVEKDLVAIGPIFDDDGLSALIQAFEAAGLVFYEDFFEMPGNWPDWLSLYAMSAG